MTYKDKGSYESSPPCITVSTENATPPKSNESRNSNSRAQIQIKPKSPLESVPRDTERSKLLDLVDFRFKLLDLVDFGGVASSKESVIENESFLVVIRVIENESFRVIENES